MDETDTHPISARHVEADSFDHDPGSAQINSNAVPVPGVEQPLRANS
jgi:hypothetical protein